MNYVDKKVEARTKGRPSAVLYSRLLLRVVIVAVLALVCVRGFSCAMKAAYNAPVEKWQLDHFRNSYLRVLVELRKEGKMTEAQFTERVKYWNNDSCATKEYKDQHRTR